MSKTYSAGKATAYGAAKRAGYTGTYEDFCRQQAGYADNAQAVEQAKNTAVSASETATAKATEASGYANEAKGYKNNASQSSASASHLASIAGNRAIDAQNYATSASQSAQAASAKATEAQGYAQSAQNVLNSIPADYSQMSADVSQLKADLDAVEDKADFAQKFLNAFAIDSASGAIASFSDGADSIPLKSLVIDINPVQAGTGDPSPDNVRPITGWTGANVKNDPAYGRDIWWNQLAQNTQASATIHDITFTNNNDGSWTLNGTSDGAAEYAFPNMDASLVVGHKYFITIGLVSQVSGLQYYLSGTGENTYTSKIVTVTQLGGYNYIRNLLRVATGITLNNVVVTPQLFDLTQMFGAGNEPATVEEFRALFPKDYYPYTATPVKTCVSAVNGNPYRLVSVSWESEAGTVYGGTLDVLTGELTVTHALHTFDGSSDETWEHYTVEQGEIFRTSATGRKSGELTVISGTICDSYKVSAQVNRANGTVSGNSTKLDFINNDYSTLTTWKANLAEHPINVVCELGTPLTYQLTPQEVNSLLGINNIWADTGDTKVEYRADTTLYADKIAKKSDNSAMIAPVETSYTATRNYTAGSLLIVDNTLYKVTANIANGGTITPNSNVTATTFSEVIASLS